jgi:hypothetical protein
MSISCISSGSGGIPPSWDANILSKSLAAYSVLVFSSQRDLMLWGFLRRVREDKRSELEINLLIFISEDINIILFLLLI